VAAQAPVSVALNAGVGHCSSGASQLGFVGRMGWGRMVVVVVVVDGIG
jgi:hypothetical protein